MKSKIAIAIDSELLKKIDDVVDGAEIRSRSTAMELLVRKGLETYGIDAAVLLLSREHRDIIKKPCGRSSLLKEQAEFFSSQGIKKIYIVAQGSGHMDMPENVELVNTGAPGNAGSLRELRTRINKSFVVMSGDTYMRFDLSEMMKTHIRHDKIATIGLMSHKRPSVHGIVKMDGHVVTEFAEKPKHPESNIINAGIYIFKPDVFNFIDSSSDSIEKNILPRLSKMRQLVGYFTMGEFAHLG